MFSFKTSIVYMSILGYGIGRSRLLINNKTLK